MHYTYYHHCIHTNALYILPPLYLHCYTATCFSPQEAILKDNWHILSAGSTKHVSWCKYLEVKTSLTSVHGYEEIKIHSLLQDPSIGLCFILTAHQSLTSSVEVMPSGGVVLYTLDVQLFLRPQFVTHRQYTVFLYVQSSSVSVAVMRTSHCTKVWLTDPCAVIPHRKHSELQKLRPTHKKGVPYSAVAPPLVPQSPTSLQFSFPSRTN